MEDGTFDALSGELYAVYGTDVERGIDYVDALLWIAEDHTKSYYIVGSNIIGGETETYLDMALYTIPDEAKEEVITMMMDFEGNRPDNFYQSLTLNDILNVVKA